MIENKLQLNDEKTQCFLIHQNKCTQNINCTSLSFGHNVISFSTTAKNVRFHFTDDMRIDAHAQDYAAKPTMTYNALAPFVTFSLLMQHKTLLSAFVLPKLDFCNFLFYGSPMYMLERLHEVQNKASRLIIQCRRQNHISPLHMSLHWLPINSRIEYKLTVSCHSFFLDFSPIYLSDLLSVYTPKGNLRSSSDNKISCIPKLLTKTFGHRSFSFAAPTIWNSLPSELKHTDSILKIKSALKTHLFRKFYT